MANEKNLVSLKDRTTTEQREIARMGGKKSGEVRRAKKTFRELIEEYGGLPDENDPRLTNDQAVMVSQYKLAKTDKPGSTKAAEFIRDTKGEAPAKNELTLSANIESITINFGKKDK